MELKNYRQGFCRQTVHKLMTEQMSVCNLSIVFEHLCTQIDCTLLPLREHTPTEYFSLYELYYKKIYFNITTLYVDFDKESESSSGMNEDT